MITQAIMENLNGNGHLVVAIPGQPEDRFEVTEMIWQGPSLVLHCQPRGTRERSRAVVPPGSDRPGVHHGR